MIRRIAAVAWKETRQILRDRLSLLMLLLVPAMMVILYGYALNFDVTNIALAVSDRDATAASRELVAAFVHSGYFTLTRAEVGEIDPEDLTEKRHAKAVLVIPEGFGRELAAGRTAEAQMLLDGANANEATTALNYASAIAAESNRAVLLRAVRKAGGGIASPIDLRTEVWYNPELKSSHFLVPGLIGYILMITSVIATALSVVREKERGTMDQLRLTPLAVEELAVGKTLPYLVLSLAAAGVVLIVARFLFGVVVLGSLVELMAATALFLLGTLGLGLFVSTVATTQQEAFQMSVFASVLPTIILSGFIFPIRSMPTVLQYVTYAVPARYYLVVLRGIILKGTHLTAHLDQLAFLALYAIVTLSLATVRLNRNARNEFGRSSSIAVASRPPGRRPA